MNRISAILLLGFILFPLVTITRAQQNRAEQLYQQALYEMEGKGDYAKAIESFNLVLTKFPKEKLTAARALLNIGRCYEKLGKNEAVKAYERIIKEFEDQTQIVTEARTRLELLKQSTETINDHNKPINRLILTNLNINAQGAPSPDGRYISYLDYMKNSIAIYDRRSNVHTVLPNPAVGRMHTKGSVWSPDGKQLAYGSSDWKDKAEIHLINSDGSGHRLLCKKNNSTNEFIDVWVEDWSRDGKLILVCFSYYNSDFTDVEFAELAVISVEDGLIRIIKKLDTWDWRLSNKMFFSPDNLFFSWSAPPEKGGKKCDVFLISIDGSREINISQHLSDDILLGWDPNGKNLFFSSDRSGNYNLWAIKIVDGRAKSFPEMIMNNIGKISPLGLTKDGSIFYSVEGPKLRKDIYNIESNIYLVSFDHQTGKILTPPVVATMNNNGFNHVFDWSPDGTKLLYCSFLGNKNNSPRKWLILTPESDNEKEILPKLGTDSLLGASAWFPNNKSLASCMQMPNNENGIFKLEIENGKIMPLILAKDTHFQSPQISHNGNILFYQTNLGSIYSYDLEKKERKLLFQCSEDQFSHSFVLSPDGKFIAFPLATGKLHWTGAIMMMPSYGGEPQAILTVDTRGGFSRNTPIRWSPDGRYIYFVKTLERLTNLELYRVSSQGGIPEPTGLINEGLQNFSIHPESKKIAFSAFIQPKLEFWVLENVFAEKEEAKK